MVVGKSTNDGNDTLDAPYPPRIIRVGSWNVGSMTGRSSEVVEVLKGGELMCAVRRRQGGKVEVIEW